jgi:predicted glycosyltransferase
VHYTTIHKQHVLIAPLDWGMGHTTRCVRIIKTLLAQHCTVTIACNGTQQLFYEKEFDTTNNLSYQDLQGYNVFYWNRFFTLAIALQIPKIAFKIVQEKRWLAHYLQHNTCHVVISDNRYGLYHSSVTSIIITHQLQIITPYFTRIINNTIARAINKFNTCWIPDNANKNEQLSGVLSTNVKVTIPTQYIGVLSRMVLPSLTKTPNSILVLLTGPVNAKKQLFTLIKNHYRNNTQTVTIVNVPNVSVTHNLKTHRNIMVLPTVNTAQLQQLIATHATIITYSGYTSIMDFYALQQPVQLIATHNQPEQEYLLQHVCKAFPKLFTPFIN